MFDNVNYDEAASFEITSGNSLMHLINCTCGKMVTFDHFHPDADLPSYGQVARGKTVMIAGHGAFGVENVSS